MTDTTPRVLAIQSDPTCPPARGGSWIESDGVAIDVVRADLGEPVPDSLGVYDGLLVLGGAMGAQDDHIADWLPHLRRLMSDVVDHDAPMLGLCLGLQLLAAARDGKVEAGSEPEFGMERIDISEAGRIDPLFAHLGDAARIPQFHRDGVPVPPSGSVILASSPLYPVQAIRMGRHVYAVQGHPEIDGDVLAEWGTFEEADILEGSGKSLDDAVTELRAADEEMERNWAPVFRGWARLVHEHAAARR